jgi:predicted porin
VAYGFGEVPDDHSGNQQVGASIGYMKGPLTIRLAHHHFSPQASDDSAKNTLLMGKWDFGVAAVSLGYNHNKGVDPVDNNDILAGVTVPFGPGTILASYIRKDDKSPVNADAHQWAVGYTHALSKRTNLYASFAHMSNKNGSVFTVGNASDPGTGDKAFNIGVRHLF